MCTRQPTIHASCDPTQRGINVVSGWRFTCKVGLRTVGCCSHIAAVLFQLGCLNHGADINDFLPTVKTLARRDDASDSEQDEESNHTTIKILTPNKKNL